MNTIEYYIGLRRKGQKWIWVSDNSTLEETKPDHFPWALFEPSGNGNCVKIWRQKMNPWTYMYMTTLNAQFIQQILDISARGPWHL